MTLGHVEIFWNNELGSVGRANFNSEDEENAPAIFAYSQKCQVMDSPGLLVREDFERNEMEALTLAAMQHLPTAVMYVMDLSGLAGDKCSSVDDQLLLRKQVRARFPRRPWIDVVSKIDLGVQGGAREKLMEVLGDTPFIELSIQEGVGVDELKQNVVKMLSEVRIVLDAMAASSQAEKR